MNVTDQIQNFLFEDTDIRGSIVTLDASFQSLLANHEYSSFYKALLSQFVAANVLLTTKLKFEGTISLQARGATSDLSLALSECTDDLGFRAILRGDMISESSFQHLFDSGVLAITVEPKVGQRYQGMVPLEKDNLSGCVVDYFELSEQLPTWLYLMPGVDCVRGLMLQALPAQICQDNDQREEDWQRVVHLASTIKDQELASLSAHEVLYRLFHEESIRVFEPESVKFDCSCSQERMERALIGLGKIELESILEEQGLIETQCEFCAAKYTFGEAEIMHLLQAGSEQ